MKYKPLFVNKVNQVEFSTFLVTDIHSIGHNDNVCINENSNQLGPCKENTW